MQGEKEIIDDLVVVKRSGQRVDFNGTKIAVAIKHAFDNVYEDYDEKNVNHVYTKVLHYIEDEYRNRKTIQVEDIQDIIEDILQKEHFEEVYQAFNNYRLQRTASREAFSIKQQHKFVKAIEKIGLAVKNSKNEQPYDLISRFGKTISTEFARAYLLESKYVRAQEEGVLYIEDVDSYALATTNASHPIFHVKEDETLFSFTERIVTTLRSLKEEQSGEHVIDAIDSLYNPVVIRTFQCIYLETIESYLSLSGILEFLDFDSLKEVVFNTFTIRSDFLTNLKSYIKNDKIKFIFEKAYEDSYPKLEREIDESLSFLLKEVSSFQLSTNNNIVSITLGNTQTTEGQLVSSRYLKLLGEYPRLSTVYTVCHIREPFDSSLFEQLFNLVSTKKNIKFTFIKNGVIESFSDGIILDKSINSECVFTKGKILLSKVDFNLARLGLKHQKEDIKRFYDDLDDVLELCKNLLLQRYDIQSNQYKEAYHTFCDPTLFCESRKLESGQKMRKMLRHGSMGLGYVGLGECVLALLGTTSIDEKALALGFDILTFINKKLSTIQVDNKLNFVLFEAREKEVRKELLAIDKSIFGTLPLLKKESYSLFSSYLNNFKADSFKKLEWISQYMNVTYMAPDLVISKISMKSFRDIISQGISLEIPYLSIEGGKT